MKKVLMRSLPLLALLVMFMMPTTVSAKTANASATPTVSGGGYTTTVKIHLKDIPSDGTAQASKAAAFKTGYVSLSSTGYSTFLRVKFTLQNGAELENVVATITKSGVETTVELEYDGLDLTGTPTYKGKIDGTVTQIDINLKHVCEYDYTQKPATTTKATCTEDGLLTRTCILCNGTDTQVNEKATGHKFTKKLYEEKYLKSAATCTEDAVYVYSCCECGEAGTETFTQTGTATGHDWGEYVVTKPATCTEAGEKTRTCATCQGTETETIPATGHNWDAGVVTTEPTEDTTGVKTFTCKTCSATYTEVIPKKEHVHAYTESVVQEKYLVEAATCTSPATYYKSCRCGEAGTETFESGDPTPHSFTNYVSDNNATCTEDGTKTATCDTCGEAKNTVTDAGSATGHDWGEYVVTKPATCTEAGEKTRTCATCQGTETETIPATGHDWDAGVVTTEPTEDATGVKTFTCKTCNATYTEEIPKKEHVHAYTESVVQEEYLAEAATCTSPATYYKSCKCGAIGTETFESGDPIAHSFTNYVSDNNATCTEDGTKTATCDTCGEAKNTVTDAGSAKGHQWDEGMITKEATEDETGVKTFTCKICKATRTEEIEKKEHVHAYTENVVKDTYLAKTATCTSPATYYKSCKCGAIGTETFESGEPIPHSFTSYVSDNNATCTEDGTKTATCDICGKARDTVTDAGSAKGHTWDAGVVTTEPTVDKEGVKTFTCQDCQTTKTESIPKLEQEPGKTDPDVKPGQDSGKTDPDVKPGQDSGKTDPTTPADSSKDNKKSSAGDQKQKTATNTATEKTAAAQTQSQTPKTGDNSALMLWVLMFMLSGAGLAGAGVIRRRR